VFIQSSRREFIKLSAAAAGTAVLGGCDRFRRYSQDENRPNIIMIVADDLGWKDLSCYGNPDINTRNIDKLAEDGVKFTNAFVASPSCSPSRAALITGQYPHTNGVTALTHIHPFKSLRPFYQTLPSILKEAGYNTAITGWDHVSPYLPIAWYGYQERLTYNGLRRLDWYSDDTKRVIDFLQRNKDNRFYLEMLFNDSHRNKQGQFVFDKEFPIDPKKVSVPEYWALPGWDEIREDIAKYYSQTLKIDKLIGEVMAELERLGIADNTLVVFMSDNGPPFPGSKMTLYDRGTGTPIIMHWPKGIRAGITIEVLANSIDIMPSILNAAGIDIPKDIQGKSYWPLVTGATNGEYQGAIFTEMTTHVNYLPGRAARTTEWKYIRNYSNIAVGLDELEKTQWANRLCQLPNQPWKRPRVHEELYHLKDDPNEQKNLAEDPGHKADLDRMRTLLDEHMRSTSDPYLGKPFTNDYKPVGN
jgi:N-sulfoglucosamine sulfohydrolase